MYVPVGVDLTEARRAAKPLKPPAFTPLPLPIISENNAMDQDQAPTPTVLQTQEAPLVLFAQALAKAQSEFGQIPRSRTVQVHPRRRQDGSTPAPYTFAYAPLEVILNATLPALNKNGFSLSQRIVVDAAAKQEFIETELLHERGGTSRNRVPMFAVEATGQAYNAAATYARRLSVTLLLCVAADDDNDGNVDGFKAGPSKAKRQNDREAVAQATSELREARVAPVVPPKPTKVYTEKEMADMEGKVVDAVQEMLEAASEGRVVGIEQIWNEIRSNEFIATHTWNKLREYPDHFATIQTVLKPKAVGRRGPKAKHDDTQLPQAGAPAGHEQPIGGEPTQGSLVP